MNQNTFQPEDFSPIHRYPEVPTKKGWYISTWSKLVDIHTGEASIDGGSAGSDFWYWNGKEWCTNDSNAYYVKAGMQDRNWFGLNHAPKSGE